MPFTGVRFGCIIPSPEIQAATVPLASCCGIFVPNKTEWQFPCIIKSDFMNRSMVQINLNRNL